ncbi:hypothetical protein [Streptomyces hydrogenans]|uniref:hypothetical protein n=1 Tax=Streptomyces hydrogenans TaxID=1873719 RepID=UPI00342CB4D3
MIDLRPDARATVEFAMKQVAGRDTRFIYFTVTLSCTVTSPVVAAESSLQHAFFWSEAASLQEALVIKGIEPSCEELAEQARVFIGRRRPWWTGGDARLVGVHVTLGRWASEATYSPE